jgi:hypothetical protein
MKTTFESKQLTFTQPIEVASTDGEMTYDANLTVYVMFHAIKVQRENNLEINAQ